MKQMTFASAAWGAKGKTTRREGFLAEMNAVIPWAKLGALVEPNYRKAGNGRQPMPLERMLRVYFMQQCRSRRRARGEFAFHVVKRLWNFTKVRYRGIYKNTVRAFAMFALANLYLVRRRWLPPGAKYAL